MNNQLKKFFTTIWILGFSLQLLAADFVISGRVFNSDGFEPLPFATIAIFESQQQKLVTGTVAGEDGRFSITLTSTGTYRLVVSFIGYENYEQTVLIGELNENYDLGKIRLEQSSRNIEEVTVNAQKQEVSADMEKKVYDMNDNIVSSGGSVLDAMKSMPGVTVGQDGKVILRGSDKVIVLIDGKQSSLTGFGNQKGLDNIPAANISKIEIINNPSAKYDASGMAGIINIVYKKETREGINGDVGFTYGLGALSKRKNDLPTQLGSYSVNPKYIPSVNLNYRKNKLNFFVQSEAMFLNKLPNNEFTTRYYDDGRITASQVPENRTQQHYIVNGGVDYFIDDNNHLTISAVYDWESHTDTAEVPYIDMHTGRRYRFTAWNEHEITGYMNYAISFKHQFAQPGHELNLSVQYTKGWEDETYYINDSSAIRQGRDVTSILATEHTAFITTDYVKPLSNGRIEGGTKFQLRNLPVDYSVIRGENSIIYPGLGEWSEWGENIYAGYANYVLEKTDFDVEAGLRVEQTDVFYNIDPANIYFSENDRYNYFEFYPNVRLSLKLNQNNKISVFFNRRVDRPGEPELRIFPKSDDQELLKIGNPYLRPQFTRNFETGYNKRWNSGSVYLAAYHRIISNPFMRVYTIDQNNTLYDVILKSYANTGSAKNTGIEFVFAQQIGQIWKLSANANWYKNSIDAYSGTLLFPYEHTFRVKKSAENTWNAKMNNDFKLPRDITLQLTGVYMAPKNIPQGREYGRSGIDIGCKKILFKGKGELNISASDIFNTNGIKQQIEGDGFMADYENYYETQVFRIGFKYKL